MATNQAGSRKKNEYVCVGNPVITIDPEQHADFVLNYQKSVLFALVERELLTPSQCERCIAELTCRRAPKGVKI
jgi:hypothetical protein